MTIIGMAIVMVQLWRKVSPLREEVRQLNDQNSLLRDELGDLTIEDRMKFHAIQVRTDNPMKWRWRVWIPPGPGAEIKIVWGDIRKSGFPGRYANMLEIPPGEHAVTLSIRRDDREPEPKWFYHLESTETSLDAELKDGEHWFNRPQGVHTHDGVYYATKVEHEADDQLVLWRKRASQHQSTPVDPEAVLPGFIIWLERP